MLLSFPDLIRFDSIGFDLFHWILCNSCCLRLFHWDSICLQRRVKANCLRAWAQKMIVNPMSHMKCGLFLRRGTHTTEKKILWRFSCHIILLCVPLVSVGWLNRLQDKTFFVKLFEFTLRSSWILNTKIEIYISKLSVNAKLYCPLVKQLIWWLRPSFGTCKRVSELSIIIANTNTSYISCCERGLLRFFSLALPDKWTDRIICRDVVK